MHRPLTILGLAVVALSAPIRSSAARGAEVSTTVYVGRHFEVREHDQPVKYLFNSDERVARVSGSLSGRERLQRLRLQSGWNLISLAVTATNLAGQLEHFPAGPAPVVSAVYRWRPVTRDFVSVSVGQTIEAGAVLWLRAQANALVSVAGAYADPASILLGTGGGYVASAGLESWSPRLPVGVTTWKYDAQAGAWRASFSGDLESMGDVPPILAPGDAVFIHTSEAVELATPEPTGRTLFYHPDHIGSATVVTDTVGAAVEETAYYPFGAVRHRHLSGEANVDYGFNQKEQDRESGLHYFEARYVVSPLGRFSSFDPLLQNLEALEAGELKKLLVEPARLNPFAYALNNPTRYVDPDGRESREARPRPRARSTQPRPRQPARPAQPSRSAEPSQPGPKLTIRLGPASKRPGEIPAHSVALEPRRHSSPSSAGTRREIPNYSEIQVTRPLDDASTGLFRTYMDGKTIESAQVIFPGPEGKELRVHMENVIIDAISISGNYGKQTETLTFTAGKSWFEDPESKPAQQSRERWDFDLRRGQ